MDNTLTIAGERRHKLLTKDWDGFFEGMHLDDIHQHTKLVIDALRAQGYPIVIVTARPDDYDYRQKTLDWLQTFNVEYAGFYMRKSKDYRPDVIVKREILDQMLADGWVPIMALDDRKKIIDMWRENGIPALQVNEDVDSIKDYTSKYAGQTLLHILVGPSGAGKSTYANGKWKPSQIISSDAIREEMFGSATDGNHQAPEDHARVFAYMHDLVKARLNAGMETVYDATNLRGKDRKGAAMLSPKGQFARYHVLDRSYDDKLASAGWRPEWLISKHHQAFKDNLKNILKGDDLPHVYVTDARQHKV